MLPETITDLLEQTDPLETTTLSLLKEEKPETDLKATDVLLEDSLEMKKEDPFSPATLTSLLPDPMTQTPKIEETEDECSEEIEVLELEAEEEDPEEKDPGEDSITEMEEGNQSTIDTRVQ